MSAVWKRGLCGGFVLSHIPDVFFALCGCHSVTSCINKYSFCSTLFSPLGAAKSHTGALATKISLIFTVLKHILRVERPPSHSPLICSVLYSVSGFSFLSFIGITTIFSAFLFGGIKGLFNSTSVRLLFKQPGKKAQSPRHHHDSLHAQGLRVVLSPDRFGLKMSSSNDAVLF